MRRGIGPVTCADRGQSCTRTRRHDCLASTLSGTSDAAAVLLLAVLEDAAKSEEIDHDELAIPT